MGYFLRISACLSENKGIVVLLPDDCNVDTYQEQDDRLPKNNAYP